MATSKTNTARRREVRRHVTRPARPWLQNLTGQQVTWTIVYLLVFVGVGSLIALTANRWHRFQVGQVNPQVVVARVEFRAIDQEKTLEKKADARDREPAIYVPNQGYLGKLRERLAGLVELGAKKNINQIPQEEREALLLSPNSLAELGRFLTDPGPMPTWEQLTEQFMDGFTGIAALKNERANMERDPRQRPSKIIVLHPTLGRLDRYDNVLINVQTDQKALKVSVTALANNFPKELRRTVIAVVMQNLQPIYLLDEEQTRRIRQLQYDNEKPVEMTYQPGDMIVPAGKIIEPLDILVIGHEQAAYLAHAGPVRRWLSTTSLIGMITLIGLALWIYTAAYNPRIVSNAMRGLAMTALLILAQALAVVATGISPAFTYATVTFPTLLAVIILTIAYDQRFALAIGVIHTLLVLVSLRLPIGFGLVMLTGLAVAVALLRDVRHRSTLVRVGLWSGLAMGLTTLLVGFDGQSLHLEGVISRIGFDAFLAVVTGSATGLVVQGVLPSIEKLFNVTTSMTLRELNDASHPLLRRLAQDAPGTYQHSLRLADMAETAADAISANGLLCKVGAMYHDIGKINKPLYFVENKGEGPNRHTKLSPAMSLLIIVGHVKDGMEMAREYNLPRPLRHFVESHHGTTLVEYFYHAAKQRREAQDKPAPTEFEFRYPGPKPQTKEAAILMLCDGTESATRTLDEPTSTRIEQLVHTIANKRLMDGQFDECSITLQDLHKIETSLVKTLCATYHSRIKYPSDKQDGNASTPSTATDSKTTSAAS